MEEQFWAVKTLVQKHLGVWAVVSANMHQLSAKHYDAMQHVGKVLGECHKYVSDRRKQEGSNRGAIVGYEDIGAEAFGRLGRAIVASCMYVELLGTCALLFILEVSRPSSHLNASSADFQMDIHLHIDLFLN